MIAARNARRESASKSAGAENTSVWPVAGCSKVNCAACRTEARRGSPAVEGVAENRKPVFGGVDADLMRFARERRGLDHGAGAAEHRFGDDGAGVGRAGQIPWPASHERGAGAQFREVRLADQSTICIVCRQAFFKLPAERAVCGGGFAKDDQPGSLFVKTMNNGQARSSAVRGRRSHS